MSALTARSGALAEASDDLLARRAGDGDVEAFEGLARRHGTMMRAYARRVLGSAGDADDVVQDALIQAWKQIGGLRDTAAVRPWMMRIVGNCALDVVRRRRPHRNIDQLAGLSDPAPGPEAAALTGSCTQALEQALATLPVEQRRCWILREMGGQSYEDIAEALNISRATARGRIARARITLAKELEDWR